MEFFNNIILEDLEVFKRSLDRRDFQFCNIISNRITMNAVFLDSKEYALIGAILKNVLPNFQKVEEEHESKVRKELIKIIDIFINYKEKLDCLFIIDKYSEYYDTFRPFFNSIYEKYTENKDYTSRVVKICLDFLKKELKENNIPLSEDLVVLGVLSEISRTAQNFGCTPHQHILKLTLSFYSRLQDYFKILVISDKSANNEWKIRYDGYRNRIVSNIENYDLSQIYIENSTLDLFEFIKEWRFMFLRLVNIMPLMQEQVKIPSRIENELKNMVSQAISKEIEGEDK